MGDGLWGSVGGEEGWSQWGVGKGSGRVWLLEMCHPRMLADGIQNGGVCWWLGVQRKGLDASGGGEGKVRLASV